MIDPAALCPSQATPPELVVQHVPKQSLVVSATSLCVPEGSNRTFTVRISGASGATIGRASGVGTIIDDD